MPSRILDWSDRSTLVLFGDGAGAVVLERVEEGGFLGFELGADGGGGEFLWLPGSGSRVFENSDKYVKMHGREVFKFATRVLVSSAEKVLAECGRSVEEVDVRAAPGERPDHRLRSEEARDPAGSRRRERRPLREHVFRLDSPALVDAAEDGRLRPGPSC